MPSEITVTVDGPTPWKLFMQGKITALQLANVLYRKPVDEAISLELGSVASDLEKDFDSTTEGWSERPTFVAVPPSKGGDRVSVKVIMSGPGEQKWIWVNYGTKKHGIAVGQVTGNERMPIRPYKAKSAPGTIRSSPSGGTYGAARAFSVSVIHPGVRARRFDQSIADKYRSGEESVAKKIGRAVGQALSKRR